MNDRLRTNFRAVSAYQELIQIKPSVSVRKSRLSLRKLKKFSFSLRSDRAPLAVTFALCGLLLVGAIFYQKANSFTYALSPQAAVLVGSSAKNVVSNLSYDAKISSYNLTRVSPESNSIHSGINSYSASLSQKAKKGISITDPATKISLGFTPEFRVGDGKLIHGRMLYPLPKYRNASLVYTLKNNGIEENIVLNKMGRGDEASFSYTLKLSDGTEARMRPDGSVGVYSGELALLGDVSTGTQQDKVLLEKARNSTKKNTLLYVIPKPVVKGDNGKVKAAFKLTNKNSLAVNVKGLKQATYPLTIDPSLALATNSDWLKGDGDNIDFSVSGQISRGGLTGGTVGTWANGTNNTNRFSFTYGGYAYGFGNGASSYFPIGTDGAGFAPGSGGGTTTGPAYATGILDFAISNGYAYAFGGYNHVNTNPPCGGVFQPACTYADIAVKTVYYSKIAADGTLGTWQATSSLVNEHYAGGAVTYNGYIYTFDNYTPGFNTNGSSTQYAKINADGTLGAWQVSGTTISSYSAFVGNSLVEYNGYLYTMGGDDAANGINKVYYAKLSSTGVGTWQATSNLVLGTGLAAGVAADGYMYLIGGCTTFDFNTGRCSNTSSDLGNTQFAPINADGSLGVWSQSSTLTQERVGAAAVAYNSRLYISGGYYCNGSGSGGSCTQPSEATGNPAFQYTKIDDVGTIKRPTTLTNFPTARWGGGTVVNNGFIYVVGGCTAAPTYVGSALQPCAAANIAGHGADTGNVQGTSGDRLDIKFAKLTTSGAIDTTYTISGYTATNGWFTDKAPCTEASLFSSVHPCPGSRYAFGMVLHAGKLFVVSGRGGDNAGTSNGNSLTADANYTTFADNGTLGSWGDTEYGSNCQVTDTGNVVNTAREFATMIDATNFWTNLYITGGRDSSGNPLASTEVFSPLGCTWQTLASNLPTARWQAAMFTYAGNMYLLGGRGSGTTVYGDILKADENGTTTTWTTACSPSCSGLPNIYGASAYAYKGRVYVTGGITNGTVPPSAYSTTVYSATIDTSGNIGTFTATSNGLSVGRYLGGLTMSQDTDTMYAVGGAGSGGLTATTDTLTYNEGGAGGIAWTGSIGSDTGVARAGAASAQYTNHIYVLGGYNGSSYLNSVQRGTISDTGSVTWTTENSLPTTLAYGSAFVANGYIYTIGGRIDESTPSNITNKIYRAPIDATTGAITGSFVDMDTIAPTNTTHMNIAREHFGATVAKGYIYAVSGISWPSGVDTQQNNYEYAPLNSDGSIGTFTTVNSLGALNNGRASFNMTTYGNYIYGGSNNVAMTTGCGVNDAEACFYGAQSFKGLVNSNHTLTFAPLDGENDWSAYGGVLASNGYLYHVGGANSAAVLVAPLMSNGGVAGRNWFATQLLRTVANPIGGNTARRMAASTFLYNGKVYVVGGCASATSGIITGATLNRVYCNGSYISTEFHGSIQAIPRVGHYLRTFQTDKDTTPVNFWSTFTSNTGNNLQFIYNSSPLSNPVWGSDQTISAVSDIKTSLNNSMSGWYNIGLTLDDSNNALFPDSTTGPTTVNSVQINYHPNSSMRLRGGGTFNGEANQSLDAP